VTFKPTAAGPRSASVQVADDASGSPQTIALSGSGSTSAIGFDKSLGKKSENVGGTTMTLTTAAAAVAHARVVLFVGWNDASRTLLSVSGGGLTWTVDGQVKDANNDHLGIASADAPAGLATGIVLTATFSASVTHGLISAASFTGIAAAAAVDAVASTTQAGVAAWSASVTTLNASDLVVGVSTIDANTTSTPTAPNLEIFDFGDVNYWGWMNGVYRIESAAGAKTVNGSWASAAGSTSNATLAIAYKAG
jgi:hypothetical protein